MDGVIPINGPCPKHGSPRITEDGIPMCLICRKEEAKAAAVPAGVVTVEDPGEAAALQWGKVPSGSTHAASRPTSAPVVAPVASGLSFEEHIAKAVEFLQKAPMPGSMAQFKLVNSATKSLLKSMATKEEI